MESSHAVTMPFLHVVVDVVRRCAANRATRDGDVALAADEQRLPLAPRSTCCSRAGEASRRQVVVRRARRDDRRRLARDDEHVRACRSPARPASGRCRRSCRTSRSASRAATSARFVSARAARRRLEGDDLRLIPRDVVAAAAPSAAASRCPAAGSSARPSCRPLRGVRRGRAASRARADRVRAPRPAAELPGRRTSAGVARILRHGTPTAAEEPHGERDRAERRAGSRRHLRRRRARRRRPCAGASGRRSTRARCSTRTAGRAAPSARRDVDEQVARRDDRRHDDTTR